MDARKIIRKLKKSKLTEEQLVSCALMFITGNRVLSFQYGHGRNSTASANSLNTLANNFFKDKTVAKMVEYIPEFFELDIGEYLESERQGEIEPTNNNDIKLGSNMTNKELVDYFNTRVRSVKDPNKRFEYEMRIMEKLDVKANNHDTDDNKANVYLPERCDACKYQIVIDKLRKEIKELKASK